MAMELLLQIIFFGAGISLFMTSSGAAEARPSVTQKSHGRLTLVLRDPNTAALAGLFGKSARNQGQPRFSRQAIDPKFQQTLNPRVQWAGQISVRQPLSCEDSPLLRAGASGVRLAARFWPGERLRGVSYRCGRRISPPTSPFRPSREGNEGRPNAFALFEQHFEPPGIRREIALFQKRAVISAGYQYRPSPLAIFRELETCSIRTPHVVGLSFCHRLKPGAFLALPSGVGPLRPVSFFEQSP